MAGGTVRLTEGIFNIAASVNIPATKIVMGGQGQGTTLKAINSLNAHVLNLASYSNLLLRDFRIDGNKANNASGNAIEVVATVNTRLHNIYIQDAAGYGVHANSASGTTLWCDQVYVNASNLHGFYILSYRGVVLSRCVAENVATANQSGIVLEDVAGGLLLHPWLEVQTYGLNIAGTSNHITLLGGVFSNHTDRAIITAATTDYITIIAPKISGSTTEDLLLRGDNCLVVEGDFPGGITNTGTGNRFIKVPGYVTENSGTATIPSGSTSVVVTHGLGVTPTLDDISVVLGENPTNDPGNIWVDTITSTQFTINCRNDPGASGLDLAWRVAVL